jgi:SAM-dependent methyltransferase
VLALFRFAIFTGAFLLFLAQPMAGKLVLPLLGGSPAVWTTSLLFFQWTLLAGYLFAHVTGTLRSVRARVLVPAAVTLAALATLPVQLPNGWTPPAEGSPVPWLLGGLALSVGAPFFVLASAGPLLQRWFAETRHPAARDPYFLYAASNAGSLLALLGYPILELVLGLSMQRVVWSIAYGTFAALAAACAVARLRHGGSAPDAMPPGKIPAIAWTTRGRWMLLAFVPSTHMMAVTLYLTTDVASAPLLWVVPLSLYLATFILAFARRPPIRAESAGGVFAVLVALMAAALLFKIEQPAWMLAALHLAALFCGALLCHGRLAAERPEPQRLTEFYLLLAVGGALGGLWNALLAPAIFDVVLEYPIALFLALVLRDHRTKPTRRDVLLPLAGLLAFAVLAAAVRAVTPRLANEGHTLALQVLVTAVPLVVLLASFRRPVRFALAFASIAGIVHARLGSTERLLHVERTFFGVHRVFSDAEGRWRRLAHGTTRHGIQYTDPRLSFRPTMYYHPTGPVGDVFRAYVDVPQMKRVGLIGLGAGTLAAYATPGLRFTYFEIDGEVERIAEQYFTYIKDARGRGATVDVVLGDARITLAHEPDGAFDLLIADAFSSDAIPLHLITREAIEMYRRKLSPDGLLVFHVSNQSLDLRPILGAIARELHLFSYFCADLPPPEGWPPHWVGKDSSAWMIVARGERDLRTIPRGDRWVSYVPAPSARAWTDDRTDLLSAFIWK